MNKFVGEVKFFGDFLCEGLDAEDFSGVMAADVEVKLKFLGDIEVRLFEFSGDEGICSVFFNFGDSTGTASGANSDF